MSSLRVRDLVTPDVHVVHLDDSIAKLRDAMSEKHIRHVPVVDDDGGIVGLVSEQDLLRRAAGLEGEVPLSVSHDVCAAVKVSKAMTWHVETIEADDGAASGGGHARQQVRVPARPRTGSVSGILTEVYFVRHVAEGGWRRSDARHRALAARPSPRVTRVPTARSRSAGRSVVAML